MQRQRTSLFFCRSNLVEMAGTLNFNIFLCLSIENVLNEETRASVVGETR